MYKFGNHQVPSNPACRARKTDVQKGRDCDLFVSDSISARFLIQNTVWLRPTETLTQLSFQFLITG